MAKPIQTGATHEVRQGEDIDSIAAATGHVSATIWDAPENRELKQKRKSPQLLLPGDKVFVPAPKAPKAQVPTGEAHGFVLKRPQARLRLRLEEDGKPRANQPFAVDVEGAKLEGKTDGDGWVDVLLPALARTARLTVGEGEARKELELGLRAVDPVTEVSGLQARLANLGYGPVPRDGVMGPQTEAALRHFQHDHGLQVTGQLDKPTQDKLAEKHGA